MCNSSMGRIIFQPWRQTDRQTSNFLSAVFIAAMGRIIFSTKLPCAILRWEELFSTLASNRQTDKQFSVSCFHCCDWKNYFQHDVAMCNSSMGRIITTLASNIQTDKQFLSAAFIASMGRIFSARCQHVQFFDGKNYISTLASNRQIDKQSSVNCVHCCDGKNYFSTMLRCAFLRWEDLISTFASNPMCNYSIEKKYFQPWH